MCVCVCVYEEYTDSHEEEQNKRTSESWCALASPLPPPPPHWYGNHPCDAGYACIKRALSTQGHRHARICLLVQWKAERIIDACRQGQRCSEHWYSDWSYVSIFWDTWDPVFSWEMHRFIIRDTRCERNTYVHMCTCACMGGWVVASTDVDREGEGGGCLYICVQKNIKIYVCILKICKRMCVQM